MTNCQRPSIAALASFSSRRMSAASRRKQLFSLHNRKHITTSSVPGRVVGVRMSLEDDAGLFGAGSHPLTDEERRIQLEHGNLTPASGSSIAHTPQSCITLSSLPSNPLLFQTKMRSEPTIHTSTTPTRHVLSDELSSMSGSKGTKIRIELIPIPANLSMMAEKHARFETLRQISRKSMSRTTSVERPGSRGYAASTGSSRVSGNDAQIEDLLDSDATKEYGDSGQRVTMV